VLPLDDRRVERFDPEMAGRPQLIKGKRQILFGGMGRLTTTTAAPTAPSRVASIGSVPGSNPGVGFLLFGNEFVRPQLTKAHQLNHGPFSKRS